MESPPNTRRVGKIYDFRQITRYMSQTVQDRQMIRKPYALYRMVTLSMVSSD